VAKSSLKFKIRQNREKRATDLAGDILEAAGLLQEPVDLFALMAQESPQLTARSGDFKDCFDGRLEYHSTHDRFVLFFNTKYDRALGEHHPRTRFSIAHELGHFYLDEHRIFLMAGGQPHSSTSEFFADDIIEREADAFAAGLLMPDKLVRPIVNSGELSAARIEEIAGRFRTSLVSTAIRSVLCSPFPCEVVAVRGGNVAWRFCSEALIEGGCFPLPKGPLRSRAARTQWQAFLDGHCEEQCAAGNPLDWFRLYGPASKTFTVWEHFLPIRIMDTIVVLLTVSEDELFDATDDDE
jgi:IrrE N-terminal-like domain